MSTRTSPRTPLGSPRRKRRLSPLTTTVVALIAVVALIVVAVVSTAANRPPAPDAAPGALPGTSTTTRVLDRAGPDAPTLVEFLDFECEVCGAFYPEVERLREKYRGKVNYAVRYFPIPSHGNSMNAAVAAEAAAQQDRVGDMYARLFQTQSQWGEQQASKADLFRGFAQELGLDMTAYDAAVSDPATQARVKEDFAAGQAMGVRGTPTFFLDGQKLELTQLSDLTQAVDRAVTD